MNTDQKVGKGGANDFPKLGINIQDLIDDVTAELARALESRNDLLARSTGGTWG